MGAARLLSSRVSGAVQVETGQPLRVRRPGRAAGTLVLQSSWEIGVRTLWPQIFKQRCLPEREGRSVEGNWQKRGDKALHQR